MLAAARNALNDLLARHEAKPASTQLFVRVDGQPLASRREHDEFVDALKAAAAIGAVSLRYGAGREKHAVKSAQLVDPLALYQMLGRTPSSILANVSLRVLRTAAAGTWCDTAFAEVETAWSRGRSWWGVQSGDAERVGKIAELAVAIVEGRHEGSDYRTFSGEVVRDTKFLERHERAVVQFLRHGREVDLTVKPRHALSEIGLDRIAVPFHVAGPLSLGGVAIPDAVPYLALPHEAVSELGFSRPPRVLLMVENMVSFHRHALEANPRRNDLVVYTGGQPSLSLKRSLVSMVALLPSSTPKLHWSDIDGGGVEIFKTMDQILGGVAPHLMSISLAAERGEIPASPVCRVGQAAGTAIAELANWLATNEGRTLEQEAVDPVSPTWEPRSE